jgi:DNA-directed RNA polymerase subunit RPC12/RpoP
LQTFSPLSQYVCAKCGEVLKETSTKIEISTLTEDCPNCGTYLASSLTRQKAIVEPAPALPKFQSAYDLTRFKIDIEQINKSMPLSSTGSLCVAGYMANVLLTRLMIRALLPANYGGLDSPHVVVVDAGNKTDFYQTVNFVKQYGLELESTLDRIIVSRTFTIYQLKSLLLRELPKVVKKYRSGIVIVPGLLDLFADPNIKKKEAKTVIARIMKLITDASSRLLVIASLNEQKYADLIMSNFDKRITLSDAGHGRLTCELYDSNKQARVTLLERELKLIHKT